MIGSKRRALYALSPVRFDCTLYPGAISGSEPLAFFESPMTPRFGLTIYRYTISTSLDNGTVSPDEQFAEFAERFARQFKKDETLRRFHLLAPTEYLRCERWTGREFVLDHETSKLQRFRARIARVVAPLRPPEVPVPEDMGTLLFSEVKNGSLVLPTAAPIAVDGVVRLSTDGELLFRTETPMALATLGHLPPTLVAVQGKTPDGLDTELDDCLPSGLSAVVPGSGALFLTPRAARVGTPSGGQVARARGLVRCTHLVDEPWSRTIEGRTIAMKPFRRDQSGQVVVAELDITPKPGDSRESIAELGHAIARLLSVAHRARTPLVFLGFDGADGSTWSEMWGNDWRDRGSHPLLDPEAVPDFIAGALPRYMARNQSHRLFALVDLYVRSFIEDTAEIQFTLASVFMEAFKFSWAMNDGSPDMIKDQRADGYIRGFKRPPNATEIARATARGRTARDQKWQFAQLLQRFAGPIDLATGGFSFIENRNALFHSGLTSFHQTHPGVPSTYPLLKPELRKLLGQMEDILLTELQYAGPLIPYGEPDKRVAFPGRAPIP